MGGQKNEPGISIAMPLFAAVHGDFKTHEQLILDFQTQVTPPIKQLSAAGPGEVQFNIPREDNYSYLIWLGNELIKKSLIPFFTQNPDLLRGLHRVQMANAFVSPNC